MANSAMHFGLGLAAGTAAGLPFLFRAFKGRIKYSAAAAKWLLLSYSAGIFALVPSFLRAIGVPETITSAWPMNLFLLHPLLSLRQGGKLIGETLIVSCFILHYFMLIMMLRHTRRMMNSTIKR